jgi:error-prone DNA polymerase
MAKRGSGGNGGEPGLPAAPARDFGYGRRFLESSPGARKEQRKERDWEAAKEAGPMPRAAVPPAAGGADAAPRRGPKRARPPLPYCELRAASAFSFLDGASQPEDLVLRAAELELPAVALLDRNGVYGAPRFHSAARQAGLRAMVGAEVALEDGSRLSLLVRDRQGYRNLCRLLTAAARGRKKGEARASWETVRAHAAGLHVLTGGDEGPLARALAGAGRDILERLADAFDGRVHVELQRHRRRDEEHRNRALVELARRLRLPLLATNAVRYARPDDKRLHDVLTAIRERTTLDAAGRLLAAQRERHLKGAAEMAHLFADLPEAVAASAELAAACDFTLADLGYRFPDYPLPPGETPASYLRHVTWNEARARFRPLTARAQAQIEHELAVIDKLDLAGYFLIVWDLVRFCKREGILVQGRGSAANSAVCYALSITAVDPVKMGLLFERFLSEERGEWPDVDLDLPSGDQREKVIQYVYRRYGENGAAMTANVITYRDRSATREVAKALGYSAEQVDTLAKRLGHFSRDQGHGEERDFAAEVREAGFDPDEPRMRLFAEMWQRIHHMPRHLGQHSGGMVIAAGRLDEVVPLEPAAMPGRTVVQWDKDDCQELGIIKVDLLGLGMLNALEEAVPLIHAREGVRLDLAHLPPDDPKTYAMLRRADTVGVFQVESRAQMAGLPRNEPRRFYDLVVQVAIIRPGPIAGKMAHPYFERRQGRQEVTYPHPSLEPILERTLGVVLFQEQILRIAMVAAGFSGGEAEALRRAMGSKRSVEQMRAMEAKLLAGMERQGLSEKAREEIVHAIRSFALYGFPESHAASFALIAYASAYLKCHHPTAFALALLNAWPMGFYHPSTLVQDAQRHGVEVRAIDVARSGWRCRWEEREEGGGGGRGGRERPAGAIRLGMKFVRGLRREAAAAIEREQAAGPFAGVDDLARRTALRRDELAVLAAAGALGSFGVTRRGALWQVARASRQAGPLLAGLPDTARSPLPEMRDVDETLADFAHAGLTVGPHPVRYLRGRLDALGIVPAAGLARRRDGERVKTAGSVIVRQRPGTASGILFMTLEDETGMSQAIVKPELLAEHRALVVGSPGLVVEGILQKRDGSVSVRAERFQPLSEIARLPDAAFPETPSHDFR